MSKDEAVRNSEDNAGLRIVDRYEFIIDDLFVVQLTVPGHLGGVSCSKGKFAASPSQRQYVP